MLDPTNATNIHNRGFAFETTGRLEDAINDYSRAIDLNADHVVSYSARGRIYDKLGQHERALQDLSRYITLAPRDVRAFDQRGNIYAGMGEFERAILNFDEVIRLAPDSPVGYVNCGQIYAKTGEWTPRHRRFRSGDPSQARHGAAALCARLGETAGRRSRAAPKTICARPSKWIRTKRPRCSIAGSRSGAWATTRAPTRTSRVQKRSTRISGKDNSRARARSRFHRIGCALLIFSIRRAFLRRTGGHFGGKRFSRRNRDACFAQGPAQRIRKAGTFFGAEETADDPATAARNAARAATDELPGSS